mmetsp:Transcript_5114/g.14264  ORF Transcript_5114/g.14264 Transcript_5114/m.14264 type:complete len:234 (-) Transcript_5114:3-704(-)
MARRFRDGRFVILTFNAETCRLQRRVHVNLNSGGLCGGLLDPPLPLLSQTVREHFILLLLSLLESFFGSLSVHGTFLFHIHDHKLFPHISIPGNGPTGLRRAHASVLIARPHLRSANLVAEPPSAEGISVAFVPEVQVDFHMFVTRDLLCLLVKLPPMVHAFLGVFAHQSPNASLVPGGGGEHQDVGTLRGLLCAGRWRGRRSRRRTPWATSGRRSWVRHGWEVMCDAAALLA